MTIKGFVFSLVILSGFVLSSMVQADTVVLKAYKEVFTDAHPKCISCHVDALPKKADGEHPWNPYGTALKKAINAAGVVRQDTSDNIDQIIKVLPQVGKIEDFKDTTAK